MYCFVELYYRQMYHTIGIVISGRVIRLIYMSGCIIIYSNSIFKTENNSDCIRKFLDSFHDWYTRIATTTHARK